MGYWVSCVSTACRYRSITYSGKLLLLTWSEFTNNFFGNKILDLESDFLKTGLSHNVVVTH